MLRFADAESAIVLYQGHGRRTIGATGPLQDQKQKVPHNLSCEPSTGAEERLGFPAAAW